MSVLRDEISPARDIVLLNAGAAIYAADLCESLHDGITRARVALSSGRALEIFEELKAFSHSFSMQAA
jgi:anthranilate phosphoribosyltransferase